MGRGEALSGNLGRHGPIDLIDIEDTEMTPKKRAASKGESRVRSCSQCEEVYSVKQAACPSCGHQEIKATGGTYQERISKLRDTAGGGSIVSDGTVSCMIRDGEELATVLAMLSMRPHENTRDANKPDTLRIMLSTNHGVLSLYLCPGHSGAARAMSEKWWRKAGLPGDMPWTARACANAISKLEDGEWNLPRYLRVKREGNWVNVAGSIFRSDYEIDDSGFDTKEHAIASRARRVEFSDDAAF